MDIIKLIKKKGKGNKNIQEKLTKESKENANLYQQIKDNHGFDIEDFIFILGDQDAFKQKYLMPHYKMYNILQEINIKINDLRKKQLSNEELQQHLLYFYKKKLELAESKMEIFFCNALSQDKKVLKTLANIVMPYGPTHTGLLIDDIVIQWGRGKLGLSLVEPWKDVKYNDYIFAVELDNKIVWNLIKETYDNLTDYITGKKNYELMGTLKAFSIIDSQLDSIAETCVYYNKNKTYHIVLENCQHFVNNILNKLKIKAHFRGEIGHFFQKVKEKCDVFDFVYKDKKFCNRKELDEYVLQIDFKELPYDHRMVLFCFRNVFEYYLRNKPNDSKYQTSDLAKEYWNELSNDEKFSRVIQ